MRKTMISLLGLLLALVLGVSLALAGCGDSGGSAATVEGSTGNGDFATETYTDPDYGFSFDYPAAWQVVTPEELMLTGGAVPKTEVTVGDPNGAIIDGTGVDIMMVRVYELNAVIDDSLLPQTLTELEQLVAGLQTQDPSLQVIEPLTETTVGTLKGYEFTAVFEWTDGTPMKTTSYFVFGGSVEYQLMVQATQEHWDADQPVFDLFLSTFQP